MGHPTSPFLDDHVRAGAGERVAISMVLSNRPGRSRPGSTATPVPDTDISLRDTTGREVATGEPGARHVRTAEVAGGLRKPFCFVVARDGGAEGLVDDLTRLASERLAPHQRPRRIVVVSELPRTATGTLQRFRLRDKWYPKALDTFGRSQSKFSDLAVMYGIRRWGNADLRTMYKADIDGQIERLGLTVPPEDRGRKIL